MISVIDLFAGPGGLNEGFSSVFDSAGDRVFKSIGSFEMESSAVKTLTLRAIYRHLVDTHTSLEDYYRFIRGEIEWSEFTATEDVAEALITATGHVHQVELGSADDNSEELIESALRDARVGPGDPWVLIGGPPCQAYSLAGRSRRANDETFASDKKHFLYREYLRIIRTFQPPIFVMENVKGLLSSTTSGESMFDLITTDLRRPEGDDSLQYDIHSLVIDKQPSDLKPQDFIIKSEQHGVPQRRHRVILLGIKKGTFPQDKKVGKLSQEREITVEEALDGIPGLRSGVSPKSADSQKRWEEIRALVASESGNTGESHMAVGISGALGLGAKAVLRSNESIRSPFQNWVIDPDFDHIVQHQARHHMVGDLKRYWFASMTAKQTGTSPKLRDFPVGLLPNHANAASTLRPFEDRFRVQVSGKASTTVVSHIAKDGHYYIHPDPDQMRSLSVREAARLQSFPDNYFFMGTRTEQYHQVGNAVPPLLAVKIAGIVSAIFEQTEERP